ncbi:MAG: 50S ribosomal protein L24 [Deltaproteobacteria bacterium]|nr:50S ribosomal protein L24 [Deltaproteobacteria bacterium]PWB64450.1 MAG: 50S ribosomal protein L24 [Deltaproteobacteria bacterium]
MPEGTLHVKKNDIVKVMTGREKGKVGRVLKIDREKGRIVIEKVNMVKRHVKPGKTNPQGGIIEKEAALAYSNVLIMCDKCNKPSRIAMRVDASGEKHRTCKRCGDILEEKKK